MRKLDYNISNNSLSNSKVIVESNIGQTTIFKEILNPSNINVTFVQSTRTQRILKIL